MLLQALETNLKEYNQIRSELEEFMEEIKTLNDLTTTNEDALRILACSKTPQSGGLNPNAMTNLRASNMSHVGIKHRYLVKNCRFTVYRSVFYLVGWATLDSAERAERSTWTDRCKYNTIYPQIPILCKQ